MSRPTLKNLLASVRRNVSEISKEELDSIRSNGAGTVIIDIRENHEYKLGAIPGAVHITRGFLELKIEEAVPQRDRSLVLYCAGGDRSVLAAESLARMGYSRVNSLEGGYDKWREAGLALEIPETLSDNDRSRYARHLNIPEVGEEGQLKLLNSKVLMVGAGGLGSPAAYYLAAAGVGTIGIVDFDVVDESNLQRQILHTAERVGTPKTESARATLLALNPGIKVETFNERLDSSNVVDILSSFDLVVDGCDNFATRYLVNDACVKLGKPNVHGSVYRFDGQVTVFWPGKGPCYRCLYPEPPPKELAPSCAEAGVLGVLPGVVGMLEAVEAIKIILGKGDTLVGRLIAYDALKATFREMRLRPDPNCLYCREGAEFPGFIDYEQFCSSKQAAT